MECFCGCGRQPEGQDQIASNLLGWKMNAQVSELMKNAIVLDALAPDRDLTNQEAFVADGRDLWLTLRAESHGEIPPGVLSKKYAKKWVKSSKKTWEKSQKSARLSIKEGLDLPESSTGEISAWLLDGTDPPWADEVKEAARRDG